MLTAEWNLDDAKQVWFEDGMEEGHKEGHKEGRKEERQYILDLMNQGLSLEEIKQRLRE